MSITIRTMTLEDYDAAIALWSGCEGMGLSGADERDNIAMFLARNPGLSFVAYDEEQLVGTVLCGHDGRRGYIYHAAVRPSHRRHGLGQALVARSIAGLRACGIQKSHLMVYVDNKSAQAFWERIGWTLRVDLVLMSRLTEL